jgi:hypothetical protein
MEKKGLAAITEGMDFQHLQPKSRAAKILGTLMYYIQTSLENQHILSKRKTMQKKL